MDGARMARRRDPIRARLLAQPKSGVRGASMFQILRCIVLVVAMMTNYSPAFAENTVSADSVMVGCRAWLLSSTPLELSMRAGFCAGLVEGIGFAGVGICFPNGVTNGQIIRVVVKYIDDRPARLNEDFRALALEALRAAWPCKK